MVRGEGAYLVECYSPGVRRDDMESAACEQLRARGVSVPLEPVLETAAFDGGHV